MSVSTTPDLTDNAKTILETRYYRNGESSPEELFWRVARAVAKAETEYGGNPEYWADKYYELMAQLFLIPNTPTMFNAGLANEGCLSACFVIPIEDTRESIAHAATAQLMTLAWGGGTGFSGSSLRPVGSKISGVHAEACGPVRILKLLAKGSETFTQAGIRQGANMFVLRVDHPDIEEFIHCKDVNPQDLSHFNISVAITDEFMQAVQKDSTYDLVNPHDNSYTTIEAKPIWDSITQSAWSTGDPGLFFLNATNQITEHPLKHNYGDIEATNPCGEQPLLPWESCNLAHLNLSKYVTYGKFDKELYIQHIHLGVRFLDDVVTVNEFPMPEQKEMNLATRRIGLGVMGMHDALIALGIPYDSDEAILQAEGWARTLRQEADKASISLGQDRGPYGAWEGSVHQRQGHSFRNAWRTTVAPTGTTSIIAGCSSGIEPLFSLAHERTTYEDIKLLEINQAFQDHITDMADVDIQTDTLLGGASIQNYDELPDETKTLFATAMDISPEAHLKMQAVWQTWIDTGISKTINMPSSATVEDVSDAYMSAWKLECKGVTIFRDGCRVGGEQVLSHIDNSSNDNGASIGSFNEYAVMPLTVFKPSGNGTTLVPDYDPSKTPLNGSDGHPVPVRVKLEATRTSITHRFQVGEQEGYITCGLYEDGRVGEIFVTASAQGTTVRGLLDAWASSVSLALQYGVPLQEITRKMKNSRFEPAGFTDNPEIRNAYSIIDYIGRWIDKRFYAAVVEELAHEFDEAMSLVVTGEKTGVGCPDCGSIMMYQEGCEKCSSCGYSRC